MSGLRSSPKRDGWTRKRQTMSVLHVIEKKYNLCVLGCHRKSDFRTKKQHETAVAKNSSQTLVRWMALECLQMLAAALPQIGHKFWLSSVWLHSERFSKENKFKWKNGRFTADNLRQFGHNARWYSIKRIHLQRSLFPRC